MNDDYEKKLTPAIIDALKGKGLNQSEIAEEYGVTRQHVSWVKQTYGGRLTQRERIREVWPFQVPVQMGNTSPFKRLRDHGEFMVTGGIGMNDDKLARLRSWYRKLRAEDVVLEFDPEIPPIKGISYAGGWAYRKRRKADGDLIIRVNKHTNITEKGRMIWRFPLTDP